MIAVRRDKFELTRCNHCMACPVWNTYQVHRMVFHSIRMNFCTHSPRRAICSTVRMPLFLDHRASECIDMIPNRMPDKLNRYIRPWSIRIPCYKLFYSVYSQMVDTVRFGRYRSLDRGSHCHRDICHQISVCMLWYSMALVTDYNTLLLLMCTVSRQYSGWLTLGSSIDLYSLLPTRSHTLRPDQRHHCHKWLVEALHI